MTYRHTVTIRRLTVENGTVKRLKFTHCCLLTTLVQTTNTEHEPMWDSTVFASGAKLLACLVTRQETGNCRGKRRSETMDQKSNGFAQTVIWVRRKAAVTNAAHPMLRRPRTCSVSFRRVLLQNWQQHTSNLTHPQHQLSPSFYPNRQDLAVLCLSL